MYRIQSNIIFNLKKRGDKMAKTCIPSSKVRKAGKDLSTSKQYNKKSKAGKILANHKKRKH